MAIDQIEIQYLEIPVTTLKNTKTFSRTQSDCFCFLLYASCMGVSTQSLFHRLLYTALMSGHGLFSKKVSSKCFMLHAECRHPDSEAHLSFDSASMVQDVIVRNKQRF